MATATELCFLPNYHRRFMSPPSSLPKAWRSSPVKLAIKNQIQTQSLQKKKRRPENVDGELFVGGVSSLIKHMEQHPISLFTLKETFLSTVLDTQKGWLANIEKMGGVQYMFLTHKDDVADHKKWSERFGCKRILHSKEVNVSTRDVEMKLDGCGPWSLNDDIQLIHTPGHTEGSICLFYKPLKVLFTGDHLAMEESELAVSEIYNFYSVAIQLDSVAMLLGLEFEWILPGTYFCHNQKRWDKDLFLSKDVNALILTFENSPRKLVQFNHVRVTNIKNSPRKLYLLHGT